MRLRRWEGWARYGLPGGGCGELLIGRYFTKWGATHAMSWKLGALPVMLLWARGTIDWIEGEVRHV